MSLQVLDPGFEEGAEALTLARRLPALKGTSIGLVSNGKEGTRAFFDAYEEALLAQHGVRRVVRLTKQNYSAPAEPAIIEQAGQWDALVAGVGD